MTDSHYKNFIVGLGETGLSVAAYLQRQDKPFVMVDTREDPPQLNSFKHRFPQAEVCLGELSNNVFANAKQIIVSPGIDINNEFIQSAVAQGAECCGDIELFFASTQNTHCSDYGC